MSVTLSEKARTLIFHASHNDHGSIWGTLTAKGWEWQAGQWTTGRIENRVAQEWRDELDKLVFDGYIHNTKKESTQFIYRLTMKGWTMSDELNNNQDQ